MKMPSFLNLCMFLVLLFEPQALTIRVSPESICGGEICQAGQKCQTVKGEPTCVGVSEASCRVSGNPPCVTSFDGKTFDFQEPGTYILAQTSGDINRPGFIIKFNNQKQGNNNTMNVTLEVMHPSQKSVINLMSNNNKLVQADNQPLENGGSSPNFKIEIDFDITVTIEDILSLKVNVPNTLKQKMSGMCGNCNGNPEDDFETPSGSQAASLADFSKSWAVDNGESKD